MVWLKLSLVVDVRGRCLYTGYDVSVHRLHNVKNLTDIKFISTT